MINNDNQMIEKLNQLSQMINNLINTTQMITTKTIKLKNNKSYDNN